MAVRQNAASILGVLAVAIGLSFCTFNIYWLLGGSVGLDTIQAASAEPMTKTAMAIMSAIKIGGALLGLAAVGPVLRALPTALRRIMRVLGWVAVTVLALRTIPFVVMDVLTAIHHAAPSGIAWFWNAWFLVWLLAFFPAMWLSRTTPAAKKPSSSVEGVHRRVVHAGR